MPPVSTNATLSCDSFESLTTFFGAAQRGEFNITTQIQQCPDLCGLAWGAGNPDLSGIGATISWIYQAVMTIIFGPLAAVVWIFAPRSFRSRFRDLHKQFFYATALVAIPVLIATIVYLRQRAALYEVTYMYYLSTMQFLALLGVSVSGAVTLNQLPKGAEKDVYKDRGSRKRQISKIELYMFSKKTWGPWTPKRKELEVNMPKFVSWLEYAIAVTLACFIGFGLYMGCLQWIRNSSISMANFDVLISACRAYGSVIPSVPDAPGPAGPAHFNKKVFATVTTSTQIALGISLPLLGLIVLILVLKCAFACLMMLLEKLFYLLVTPYLNFFVSLAFSMGMLFCLGKMQKERRTIKKLAGSGFEDDQWGFGQVLTVFVWIPLSLNVVRWIIMLLINKMKPDTTGLLDPENPSHFLKRTIDARLTKIVGERSPNDGLALHQAISQCAPSAVEELIKNGADVNAKNEEGKTALHLAACGGHENVVKLLIEKGADVNATDDGGQTPLLGALDQGHTTVVLWLAEHGSDVNFRKKDGRTIIGIAAAEGYQEVVNSLIKNGSDINSPDEGTQTTALYWALDGGQDVIARWLIGHGAQLLDDWRLKWRQTEIRIAVSHGDTQLLERLLGEEKQGPNSKNHEGRSALHIAVTEGSTTMVQLLLEVGKAVVNLQNNEGQTALHLAVIQKSITMVQLLLNAENVDVNMQDSKGRTALHLAVTQEYYNIGAVQLLVEADQIDLNVQSHEEKTALHLAAQGGHKEVILILVKKGADTTIRDKYGDMAWNIANQMGHKQIASYLQAVGKRTKM